MEYFKNREKEPIKIQQEIEMPWEMSRQDREESAYKRYRKKRGLDKFDLNENDLQLAKAICEREYIDVKLELAKKWYQKQRDNPIIYVENAGDNFILNKFNEYNGLNELKQSENNEEVKKILDKLEQLDFIIYKLNNGEDIENVTLMFLHFAQKRYEKLLDEIQDLSQEPESTADNFEQLNSKQAQIKELFVIRKKFAESISGRSLEAEVEPLIETKILPQDQFINNNLTEKAGEIVSLKVVNFFIKEWEKLNKQQRVEYGNLNSFVQLKTLEAANALKKIGVPAGIDPTVASIALLEQGYTPTNFKKTLSLWQRIKRTVNLKSEYKIEIKKNEKLSLADYNNKINAIVNRYTEIINQEAVKSLKAQWENLKQQALKELVDEKISQITEQAENNLLEIFDYLKNKEIEKTINEIKHKLKKNEKESKNVEKIESTFKEKEIDITKFMKDVLYRKDPLQKLTGKLDNDLSILKEFFESYDLDIDEGDLLNLLPKKIKESYNFQVKKQKGFLFWIFDAIALMFKD